MKNLKKLFSVLLALALSLTLAGAALAEATEAEPEKDRFEGEWICNRATMLIILEDDGYRVNIRWGSSAWEESEWDYGCILENGVLVSTPFGTCDDVTYDDNGNEISRVTRYDDDVSSFTLTEDGHLVWKSEKEQFEQEMAFEFSRSLEEVLAEDAGDSEG